MAATSQPAAAIERGGNALLSPLIVFPVLWLVGGILAQIRISDTQSSWSPLMWTVAVVTPVAFLLGGLGAREAIRRRPVRETASSEPRVNKRLRILLLVGVALGWLELLHQFVAAGTIPLFDASISAARFSQPGGPTILLTDCLTAAAIVALCLPRRLRFPEAGFELGVAASCFVGFALQGGRTTLVLVLVTVFSIRWLQWGRPRMRVLAWGVVLLLTVICAFFYQRTAQQRDEPFEAELYAEILPSTPLVLEPLIPVYLGFATNFEALARVVDHYPAEESFAHGSFSAHGIDYFVPTARDLSDVSADLSPPWITSTVAGTLWADWGMLALVPGLALVGAIAGGAFELQRRTGLFRHRLLAGYMLYLAAFGVYTNLWTQHIDWLIVSFLLLLLGAAAERSGPLRQTADLIPRPWVTSGNGHQYAPVFPRDGERSELTMATKATSVRTRARVFIGGLRDRLRTAGPGLRTAGPALRTAGPGLRAALAGVGLVVALLLGILLENVLDEGKKVKRTENLEVVSRLRLPGAVEPTRQAEFLTDGDTPDDNSAIFRLRRRGGQAIVNEYAFTRSSVGDVARRARVSVGPDARSRNFDVARWRQGEGPSLFATIHTREGVGVRVLDLDGGRIDRTEGFARIARSGVRGAHRDARIATFSGKRPDLFIIDRGLARERATLSVFSGESRFAKRIFQTKLPLRGLDPTLWSVDVGRTSANPRPDLVFVTRAGASRHPEVHILSGRANFQKFTLQRATALERQPPSTRFQVGTVLGRAVLYVLGAGKTRRAVQVVALSGD